MWPLPLRTRCPRGRARTPCARTHAARTPPISESRQPPQAPRLPRRFATSPADRKRKQQARARERLPEGGAGPGGGVAGPSSRQLRVVGSRRPFLGRKQAPRFSVRSVTVCRLLCPDFHACYPVSVVPADVDPGTGPPSPVAR